MGDPWEFQDEPGGELGIFTLTCLLNVPLRMVEVIRQRHPRARDINIIGMPKMSYKDDEQMGQYVKFMDEYINHQVSTYSKLQADIQAFNMSNDEIRRDLRFNIAPPCGWPLKFSEPPTRDSAFLRFGLFPFPIIMWFKVAKQLTHNVNLDSFTLNIGTLPPAVSKKERDFLTCDPSFQSELVIEDSHILTSQVLSFLLQICFSAETSL